MKDEAEEPGAVRVGRAVAPWLNVALSRARAHRESRGVEPCSATALLRFSHSDPAVDPVAFAAQYQVCVSGSHATPRQPLSHWSTASDEASILQ